MTDPKVKIHEYLNQARIDLAQAVEEMDKPDRDWSFAENHLRRAADMIDSSITIAAAMAELE